MHTTSTLSALLGLALVLAAPATPQTVVSPSVPAAKYGVDTTHSSVEFVARFMGLSKVRGRFADFDGTIVFDEARPERSTVSLVVDVTSIDTDNDLRDRHLRSPDWFAADSHSVITFQSRAIERLSGEEFVVRGPLTIRGTTREVEIPVTMLHGEMTDAWGNRRIGFEGSLEIDRKEFGVEGGNFFNQAFDVARVGVADEVRIEFTISGRILNMDKIAYRSREKPSIGEALEEVMEQEGITAAVKRFHELKSERPDDYNFAEAEINKLGYKLLQHDRPRDALEIFKLNLSAHPESTNVYDSLGEAHAAAGNREAAIENYEKVVAADPHATGAIEMLRWLRAERSRVTLVAR